MTDDNETSEICSVRQRSDRLGPELAKLTRNDLDLEKELADEGLASELDQWPSY